MDANDLSTINIHELEEQLKGLDAEIKAVTPPKPKTARKATNSPLSAAAIIADMETKATERAAYRTFCRIVARNDEKRTARINNLQAAIERKQAKLAELASK